MFQPRASKRLRILSNPVESEPHHPHIDDDQQNGRDEFLQSPCVDARAVRLFLTEVQFLPTRLGGLAIDVDCSNQCRITLGSPTFCSVAPYRFHCPPRFPIFQRIYFFRVQIKSHRSAAYISGFCQLNLLVAGPKFNPSMRFANMCRHHIWYYDFVFNPVTILVQWIVRRHRVTEGSRWLCVAAGAWFRSNQANAA